MFENRAETESIMKLYLKYLKIHVQSMMEHKASFFLTMAAQVMTTITAFLGISCLFLRFHSVQGFSYQEVLLGYSVILFSFSLAEMFARGFDAFGSILSNGQFDRILLRPRNDIFQVLATKVEFTRIGKLLQAFVMMLYVIFTSDISWTPCKAAIVVLMIFGGAALFSGLFLVYAALCFFTTQGLEFLNIFTDGGRELGKYPMGIYGKAVLRFFTFLVPLAMIQYYPLLYLTGRDSRTILGLCPLTGFVFLIPCHALWKFGVRHFVSTGS